MYKMQRFYWFANGYMKGDSGERNSWEKNARNALIRFSKVIYWAELHDHDLSQVR